MEAERVKKWLIVRFLQDGEALTIGAVGDVLATGPGGGLGEDEGNMQNGEEQDEDNL